VRPLYPLVLMIACVLTGMAGHWWLAFILSGAGLGWMLYQQWRLWRWLQDTGRPVPAARGLWGAIFDALHHQKRRTAAQVQRLHAVVERLNAGASSLPDAVLMLDESGGLLWWNPAAQSLLGLRHPQDNHRKLLHLLREPAFTRWFEQPSAGTLEMPAPGQPERFLHWQMSRYGNGECLLLARDITRLKQLEQMRKDFVANVSHEIGTPLTVLVGWLETLQEAEVRQKADWQATLGQALSQMQQQAGRMRTLLADLLLLSELEDATPQAVTDGMKRVDVSALLRGIVQELAALPAASGIQWRLELDETLFLDGHEQELRSACVNLLGNAVKYSPQGGPIRVRWQQQDSHAVLCVHDSGIGIDPQQISRLTERFYRSPEARAYSGSGLGLAIVKHVLLRHRGQLQIDSQPGRGSCFCCRFALPGLQ